MSVGVMLVDDHAVVRTGYRRLLELEDGLHVVAEHASADAAYADVPRHFPGALNVVVLDLSMPRGSGLSVLARLHARWPGLKVLVFSMHDSAAMVQQALKAGAAGYVTKSSEPEALVAALRRVASGERSVLSNDIQAAALAREAPPHASLTPREFEVLRGIALGRTLEEIAAQLHIATKTVSNLQSQIRQRLGVNTAVELLRYAQAHDLVATPPVG